MGQINNKLIAKNTIFLYLRQIVIMLVSLYTSRVILSVLGEENFGIYNVVGGVVILFTFLNSALSNSTQRFLNFEMGKDDKTRVRDVFCMSINIHVLFSIIILLVTETIGLYFANKYLNISPERKNAAMWAYQFSIISTLIQILRIPFGAIVIAYEKMNFYAYVSIVEAFLRLGIVYLLLLFQCDKLILYSGLFPLIQLMLLFIYYLYVSKKFETAKYKIIWNAKLFKKMVSFSGWSLLGGISSTGSNYGLNLLMNIFCGVVVNAAMGIANQVNAAVGSLVSSFQTAFAPQIVKSYAAKDIAGYHNLIIRTSKFSFFIMLIMSMPVMLYTDTLLKIWLVDVPQYTEQIVQLILIYTLIDALSGPFWIATNATGDIKKYYIITSFLTGITLPIAYWMLSSGFSVVTVVSLRPIMNIFIHMTRVLILTHLTEFPVLFYVKNICRFVSPTIIYCISAYYIFRELSFATFTELCILLIFTVSVAFIIYFSGLTSAERVVVGTYLKHFRR